ncbi:MAG: hypothetical protein II736_06175 [Clostridia bacterium]|nr:hypothetical protein [Clostridia bacterium]
MYLMGIDIGTSGCKAVVFDEKWRAVCRAYREYSVSFRSGGRLDLDAETVFDKMCEVIRQANRSSPEPVGAFAVSAIGDVIVPVGEDDVSVRPSIIDFDPRGDEEIRRFCDSFGRERFFSINGMPPLYIGSIAKILWIRDHEPENYAKVKRWATYEDLMISKLGLPPTVSYSEASRTMLFDIRKKDWSDEILGALDMTRDLLPVARPSGTVIGTLPDPVAELLGFNRGVTAVVGGHDMVCAAVGAGLDENDPGTAVDIAGTIEGVITAMKEPITDEGMLKSFLPCYPGAENYVTFSVNLTAGSVVRWFRDNVAPDWYAECKAQKRDFYEYMQRTMDPGQPGELTLIPHFEGSGNPFFSANSRGVIYGMTLGTKREDVGRAVIEGLALDLRLQLETFRKEGIRIDAIRAVGGGATIDRQLQLKANVTGVPVIKGYVSDSSTLGAAAYAAVGMGVIPSPADAYRRIGDKEIIFTPDRDAHERFLERYEFYRRLVYAVNAPDFR